MLIKRKNLKKYIFYDMFNKKLNILITGAKGQLGSYLVDYF